jgi:signal peptidase I
MGSSENKKTNLIETLQSLIVAFVFAMVFRGFVVEGFVIPTGSMAPTLLGQHLLVHSDQTGHDFTIGYDPRMNVDHRKFSDPLLGRNVPLSMASIKRASSRLGDRVLVLKTLYPFFGPDRYDVVVFKNPTDTQGPSANYIKRLIGLPGETIWIADGDIFASKNGDVFEIQRKPEFIQRSLWRLLSDTDAIPIDKLALSRPWQGSPWIAKPNSAWTVQDRTWYCTTTEPSVLTWDQNRILIDDWLPYNMLMPNFTRSEPIADIRVSATITPETAGLTASFTLEALQHRFVWSVSGQQATLVMLSLDGNPIQEVQADIPDLSAGVPVRLECWHADQAMSLYVDGDRVSQLLYEFDPEMRLRLATNTDASVPVEDIAGLGGRAASLEWHFDGSPFAVTRIQVAHDLYYRSNKLQSTATKNPTAQGNEELVRAGSHAFGTHPDKLAILGEDQFMMAGDNSEYSLDGRLWGNPDEYVASQIDDSPFVVHRDLLIGKAWGVYWLPPPLIPEFHRFRFIR